MSNDDAEAEEDDPEMPSEPQGFWRRLVAILKALGRGDDEHDEPLVSR